MAATLEDHERRIAALEKAQTARGENAIKRLEEKVGAIIPAVAGMVAESERHLRAEMSDVRAEVAKLRTDMKATEDRLTKVTNSAVNRMVDTLNEKFDEVMEKLDRPKKRKAKK